MFVAELLNKKRSSHAAVRYHKMQDVSQYLQETPRIPKSHCNQIKTKSNLHYTRTITQKHVTSGGAHHRGLAPGLQSRNNFGRDRGNNFGRGRGIAPVPAGARVYTMLYIVSRIHS